MGFKSSNLSIQDVGAWWLFQEQVKRFQQREQTEK
jgi:hypothetical protein